MAGRTACKLASGRRLKLLAVALCVAGPAVPCQVTSGDAVQVDTAVTKLPAYDVVSIRLNNSGSGSTNVDTNR
jgi:hypothetical protein